MKSETPDSIPDAQERRRWAETRAAVTVPKAPKKPASAQPEPAAGIVERGPTEKNAAGSEFGGVLLAWGTPGYNPHLLSAYVPGQDPNDPMNLVKVTVRNNRNFLRGMTLPGPGRKLVQTGDRAFDLVGACPRWRGKW